VVNNDVFEAASQDFQRAIDRDPDFALAYAGLAESRWRAYNQVKNPVTIDQAIDAAHKAIALDPMQAAAQLSLANVLNLTGRSAEALSAVDRAIELLPSNDDAYRLRGRLLLQAGKTDEGFASLARAVALRPTYWSNHETLGFWLYRAGRVQDAAASYQRVTELAPDYFGGYFMLGTTLHRLGRVEEAIGYYEHSVRLGPNASTYSNLAYSYYETGRYRDALAAYQEALKRDARSPATHRNIGDVYSKLGRREEARKAYETAVAVGEAQLKVNRRDAPTISIVALSEAKLGRTLAAERHAAEALVLAPKDMEVAVKNAEVYAILRQPSRSLRALKAALSLGYDPALARKNEELQSIHATPEFAELLATSKK
jgi:eukaryotic-like serine/threonine-protein kinase